LAGGCDNWQGTSESAPRLQSAPTAACKAPGSLLLPPLLLLLLLLLLLDVLHARGCETALHSSLGEGAASLLRLLLLQQQAQAAQSAW
jgi:hypothetical protein